MLAKRDPGAGSQLAIDEATSYMRFFSAERVVGKTLSSPQGRIHSPPSPLIVRTQGTDETGALTLMNKYGYSLVPKAS